MGGDYTRVRFDPGKAYTGVLEQQGRVRLEAEFNEFVEMDDRRQRAEIQDIVGRCAVPATTKDAFLVVLGGTSFTLGVGRAYVDGILAECRGEKPYDVFNESLGELYSANPLSYEKQPFVYTQDLTVPLFPKLSPPGSTDIAYLDVWQREVTFLEDADLKEQALGGPDTTARVQTAWQVKVLQGVTAASCDDTPPEWLSLVAPSTARLTSAAPLPAPSPSPCVIEPEGGYTGLENRLYRVEIHTDGTVGGATPAKFKWSRDNASVAFGINKITKVPGPPVRTMVELTGIGRDKVMRLKKDEFVEILDDDLEFSIRERHAGGHMAQIFDVDEANATITLDTDLSAVFAVKPLRHPRLRRWDTVTGAADALASTKSVPPIDIEEGIKISFGPNAAATLHAGDYWVFAARTATGTIEELQEAPPRGILHHYCRLALVSLPNPPTDCRGPQEVPHGEGCCTAVVKPGDDIQAAIDSLPPKGGCVCLKVGDHPVDQPIRIEKSGVMLHGESIGARVFSTASRRLLIIGDPEKFGVTDVDVHDIRFDSSGGLPDEEDPDQDAIICVIRARRVAVHDCALARKAPMDMSGVMIVDSQEVRIEKNLIESPLVGVRTIDNCSLVMILENRISGPSAELVDDGVVGVHLDRIMGGCRVANNRIEGFVEGIFLSAPNPHVEGSLIAANRIARKPPSGLTGGPWGIEVEASGCTIQDNSVDVVVGGHGGIRVRGSHSRVEGNDVHRLAEPPEGSIPLGIRLETGGLPEDDGVISGNRLSGAQNAIEVQGGKGVEVLNNDIDIRSGTGAVGIGIILVRTSGSLVSGNRILGAKTGVLMQDSHGERVIGNQLSSGSFGILAEVGLGLLVADNIVEDMASVGIGASKMMETTTVSTNRLVRCVQAEKSKSGAAIAMLNLLGDVVVEFNHVLDAGIREGSVKVPVVGIHVQAARSRIQSNHVTYSDPKSFDVNLECRALLLDGVQAQTTIFDAPNDWALILDNSFVGPGFQALVEIRTDEKVRIDRVTFTNNYCEHYATEPDKSRATVWLWGSNLIVQGNHVKARRGFPSFQFNVIKSVIFMGNIMTGDPLQLPTPLPTPPANFNIKL